MNAVSDSVKKRSIAFVWDALGPQHVDRVNAMQGMFKSVFGVQIFPQSSNYNWTWAPDARFERRIILRRSASRLLRVFIVPFWCLGLRIRRNVSVWFLCNYEEPYTFFTAILLRLSGAKVFVVQDSKFDDYQRGLALEIVKWIMYRPYSGAIVSGERTRSYLRFLGVNGPIQYGYNTGDVARLAAYTEEPGPDFASRPFLYVGRLIPKKNVAMLVEAYAEYVRRTKGPPRELHIVGSGPEEADIRKRVAANGVAHLVQFQTWSDQPLVLKAMARALYLLLPSITEQFGNVVGEACSVGLPAIVSTNVGARDRLVEEFRSGFSIPAHSTASWTQAMLDVDGNEDLWRRLRAGARALAPRFDVADFREAVGKLVEGEDVGDDHEIVLAESVNGQG